MNESSAAAVPDPNNRPGGANLVLTAKTANTIEFYDGASFEQRAVLAMPASTHELVLSPDGRKVYGSVYGGGIFGKNQNPDHRIVVVDLASRSVDGFIDTAPTLAPHSLMFDDTGLLWVTGELDKRVIAIDPPARRVVATVDYGSAPHWLAISHATGKLFASNKTADHVTVIDTAARRAIGRLPVPSLCESLAVSPNGDTVFVCAHTAPRLYVFDARTHALVRRIDIKGTQDMRRQLRRVRISPDDRWVVLTSHLDGNVAIFERATLKQVALTKVGKAPMGIGFPPDGHHILVCNHDDGVVSEIELPSGRINRSFLTGAGCEFVISYG